MHETAAPSKQGLETSLIVFSSHQLYKNPWTSDEFFGHPQLSMCEKLLPLIRQSLIGISTYYILFFLLIEYNSI